MTQHHLPGGKHPNTCKGKSFPKALSFSGNKNKSGQKGKGNHKEKAQGSANVLNIMDLLEWSITSSESINFSCYETSEKVEWFLDSGCTDHITPEKSDFIQYRELGQAYNAENADRKYLRIEGYRTVIGHSIMPDGTASLQIQNTLYVPEVNEQLFLLIAMGQQGSMSQTMKEGTTVSQNGTPFNISTPKSGNLHSFDIVFVKNWNEVPWVIITTLSDYTLWHRRMGHAHQCIIKHLRKKTQKVVLIKSPKLQLEHVKDVKKESPRDSPSQLQNLGQMTPRCYAFWSGWNASLLHQWIQIYHLLRWSLFLWCYVLFKEQKQRVHSIQNSQSMCWKTIRYRP